MKHNVANNNTFVHDTRSKLHARTQKSPGHGFVLLFIDRPGLLCQERALHKGRHYNDTFTPVGSTDLDNQFHQACPSASQTMHGAHVHQAQGVLCTLCDP